MLLASQEAQRVWSEAGGPGLQSEYKGPWGDSKVFSCQKLKCLSPISYILYKIQMIL